MTNTNKQKFRSPALSYMGYLFQTFLKRPFGYIIAILYIVYLSVILVIVPAALHFEPLFIWNIGGFNMPIFNLFFIAGSAASIAVAVFRTGRDDGSDLNISAKPITKLTTVLMKTAVYLLIMLAICLLTTGIVALVKPIFGTYDVVTNITGITDGKYRGLLLSVLIGNIVNMLFFGGISVFISMIGGQVITIIGTVSIVFVMCLMNFLFPQILESGTDILSEKYDTEILSYSCNTVNQVNNPKAEPFNFATIQCITDDDGLEEYHYDTKKYWDLAEKEAGRKIANYIDFGKQLSSLYSAFGLDESKLKEASKLVIGTNNTYNYVISNQTHITTDENIGNGDYPIAYYTIIKKLGKEYPIVHIIGGDMTLSSNNWYLISTLYQLDFHTINYVSLKPNEISMTNTVWSDYAQKPWNRMQDLLMTNAQIQQAKQAYSDALEGYRETISDDEQTFGKYCHDIIKDNCSEFTSNVDYDELSKSQQYNITAKFHLIWSLQAQQNQISEIDNWWEDQSKPEVAFPFISHDVIQWNKNRADKSGQDYYFKQHFNSKLFTSGIAINIDDEGSATEFSRLVTSSLGYAETYSNMYKYYVYNFYSIPSIIATWTIISSCLFASSVIVYKRTDFK